MLISLHSCACRYKGIILLGLSLNCFIIPSCKNDSLVLVVPCIPIIISSYIATIATYNDNAVVKYTSEVCWLDP